MNMPYQWVEYADSKTQSDILSAYEEYSKLPMTDLGGVSVVSKSGVKKEWERHLSDALFRVTGFSQFFGSLAFQCTYLWSVDIPTAGAAVFGDKFYVIMNPIFMFNYLKKGEYHSFVVVHEVNHIFFEHGDRAKERGYDPDLFNKACDYFIHVQMDEMVRAARTAIANLELLPKDVFPICFDTKYRGMTEDEIYEELLEEQQEQQKNGGGDGQSGSGESGSGQQGFDEPIKSENPADGASTSSKQAIATAVRAAATQAQMNKNAGDAELGIIRKFLEATEPKVRWQDQFADFFEKTRDDRPTYSKYSRRSNDEVVFPSFEGEKIRVGFGLDTSGSMGEKDLTEATSELQGILDQIGSWEVDVATADSAAYKVASLSSEEDDDLTDLTLPGGGGTRMSSMVELFQEEWGDDEYNVMVIFTDGFLMHGDILDVYNHEIPLIVVVTSNGNLPEWLAEEVTVIQIND